MQDKRYPEGGDSIPALSFNIEESPTVRDKLRTQRRLNYLVPKKAKRSGTSNAADCLVKGHFSDNLQKCMLNYSYTLVTTVTLSGEV